MSKRRVEDMSRTMGFLIVKNSEKDVHCYRRICIQYKCELFIF